MVDRFISFQNMINTVIYLHIFDYILKFDFFTTVNVSLGSIPGFFRFSTWMLGFLIDINHYIEHKK